MADNVLEYELHRAGLQRSNIDAKTSRVPSRLGFLPVTEIALLVCTKNWCFIGTHVFNCIELAHGPIESYIGKPGVYSLSFFSL